MKDIILYIWQLPQHIVAIFICLYLKLTNKGYRDFDTEEITESSNVLIRWNSRGAMSLGRYIFLSKNSKKDTIIHEMGHCRQSFIFGPLYLVVIGLPSIIHAGIYTLAWTLFRRTWDYYSFYTEYWLFPTK